MNNELEQQAIETFAAVPEIYQQAFRDAGADFPDELVVEIKKDPNQAVNLVNSDKNLKSAVINVFKSNKDAILKYMQQVTSMFKQGGKFNYLDMLQSGGRITRRQAFEEAQKNKGYTKAQARLAYRNARYAGLDRQSAFKAIMGQPQEDVVQTERPTLINAINTPTGIAVSNNVESISARPVYTYNNSTPIVRRTNYQNATRAYSLPPEERITPATSSATNTRKGGLTVVNSTRREPVYTTTVTDNTVVHPLPESEQAAHDAYIASLNNGSNKAPVVSEKYQKAANDIWSGNNFGYYDRPRPGEYVMQEPEKYIRTPDGRWISPDAAYVNGMNYGPVLVRRQGGKVEQENNIRKNYIKDSKEAAKESSEKMKKISKNYDKKLEKVQKNQRGGSVESGYSYDYPGKETVVSGPVRMTLNTVPSRGYAMEDSTFTYFGPNNESIELHRIYDNNNVFPKTFNQYGSQPASRWEGLRNKWEALKKFYIEHPEFNNRKSYTQY